MATKTRNVSLGRKALDYATYLGMGLEPPLAAYRAGYIQPRRMIPPPPLVSRLAKMHFALFTLDITDRTVHRALARTFTRICNRQRNGLSDSDKMHIGVIAHHIERATADMGFVFPAEPPSAETMFRICEDYLLAIADRVDERANDGRNDSRTDANRRSIGTGRSIGKGNSGSANRVKRKRLVG